MPNCLKHFAPDGVCYESLTYWGYTTSYLALYLKAVEQNGGDRAGIGQLPGISKTALYFKRTLTPSGQQFNFGNTTIGEALNTPSFFFFSKYYRLPEVAEWFRTEIKQSIQEKKALHPLFFLTLPWFDAKSPAKSENIPSLEVYHNSINDLVVLNGNRKEKGSVFLVAKGGTPNQAHQQMDCGTFIIESDSVWSPLMINRLTLNVSYKWIYLNSRYIHGKDAITQLSRAYSEDDPTVSLYSFYNMYNSDKLYTTLTLSPTIGLWSPQFNFLLLQQWYKVETSNGTENFNNPILNFAWNNNFKLPLGISLDVDLGFDTPGDNENTKVEEWCWFANISLYKSFLKDRLSVQLKAYDLFNSYQAKSTVYSGNRLMTGKMEARRNIGITLRYKFNAAKRKDKGTGAGDSQKNRM